ncbi:MAG: PqqD family protein [Oscillospiraceae bacterium]|nr:PqqD family protein [Oscillospiraceae bacterium]
MSKKKNVIDKNYLDYKPMRNPVLNYTTDDEGIVTLEIENKGAMNRIFQKLFKKPKITYIHLDETGSFIWPYLDGEMTITELGVIVKEHFGEKAEPLYERLAKYIQILVSYKFVIIE